MIEDLKTIYPTVSSAKMAFTNLGQDVKDYAFKEAYDSGQDAVYLLKHEPWILLSFVFAKQKKEREAMQEKLRLQDSQLSLL